MLVSISTVFEFMSLSHSNLGSFLLYLNWDVTNGIRSQGYDYWNYMWERKGCIEFLFISDSIV